MSIVRSAPEGKEKPYQRAVGMDLLVASIKSQMDQGKTPMNLRDKSPLYCDRGKRCRKDHLGRKAGRPAKGSGKKVILAAADTFAAAIEQLTSGPTVPVWN